jgi:hypothetical protein
LTPRCGRANPPSAPLNTSCVDSTRRLRDPRFLTVRVRQQVCERRLLGKLSSDTERHSGTSAPKDEIVLRALRRDVLLSGYLDQSIFGAVVAFLHQFDAAFRAGTSRLGDSSTLAGSQPTLPSGHLAHFSPV